MKSHALATLPTAKGFVTAGSTAAPQSSSDDKIQMFGRETVNNLSVAVRLGIEICIYICTLVYGSGAVEEWNSGSSI